MKAMSVTQTLSGLKADIPAILAAGDINEVRRLRTKLANATKSVSECRSTFDAALKAAQSGFNGEDFLSGIDPFVKPGRGRPASQKPEVDPNDFL